MSGDAAMIWRIVICAILITHGDFTAARTIENKGSDVILKEANSVALVRVAYVQRNEGLKKSPCANSGEKYLAQVVPIRMVDGAMVGEHLCFDQSPSIDQTLLVAVGTKQYPLWVRAFWSVQQNLVESSPHIRLEPGDWIDQLATNRLLVQDVCVDEQCRSVQYYPYVTLDDLLKAIVRLRESSRGAA